MTYDDFYYDWKSDTPFIGAHTSGSTGTPKCIRLTKAMMRRSAQRTIASFGLNSHSYLYSCISPEFIGGKMMMVRALECGCEFGYETPSNTPHLDGARHATLVSVVPSQMRFITAHPEIASRADSYLVGGSALPCSLADEISDAGLDAWESYGMTETSSHIAVRKISSDSKPFIPLPGICIRTDHRGCLVIDMGVDGVIATNDVVIIDDAGGFTVVGRHDNAIITGGLKVHPEKVEREIGPIMGGRNYCLVGLPDPIWGEAVVLVIEGKEAPGDEHLLRKIYECQPCHCVPKKIRYVSSLPRLSNGKLDRREVVARIKNMS